MIGICYNKNMLFKIPDYSGTYVILSKDTWNNKLLDPIFGHPEIRPYRKQIKQTITDPEFVYQSIWDTRCKLLLRRIGTGEFARHFLSVVVKYVTTENKEKIGYVSTIMINRKLPASSMLLWQKKVSI